MLAFQAGCYLSSLLVALKLTPLELAHVGLKFAFDDGHEIVETYDVDERHCKDGSIRKVDNWTQLGCRAENHKPTEDNLEDKLYGNAFAEEVCPRLQAVVRPRNHGGKSKQHYGDGEHIGEPTKGRLKCA